jgi:hypothetical protein
MSANRWSAGVWRNHGVATRSSAEARTTPQASARRRWFSRWSRAEASATGPAAGAVPSGAGRGGGGHVGGGRVGGTRVGGGLACRGPAATGGGVGRARERWPGPRCNAPNFGVEFFLHSPNSGVTSLSHFFSLKPHPFSKTPCRVMIVNPRVIFFGCCIMPIHTSISLVSICLIP